MRRMMLCKTCDLVQIAKIRKKISKNKRDGEKNSFVLFLGDKMMQSVVATARRVVVKVGSALVTNDGRGLDRDAIERWATQISALQHDGKQVILVSSGAVAEGVLRLGWERRPSRICPPV